MAKFGLSQSIRRVEDPRLLKGDGQYTADISLPGEAHGVVLRSPHAHAAIKGISTSGAKAIPGVLGVYTAADLAAEGLGPLPCLIPLKNSDGTPLSSTPRSMKTHQLPAVCFTSCMPKRPVRSMDSGPGGFG
ncbi:MAG: hypothetical protein ACKO4X_17780 [Alphaproteobacteria bacterium]